MMEEMLINQVLKAKQSIHAIAHVSPAVYAADTYIK